MKKICCFDVETSGLDTVKDRIIQVGAILKDESHNVIKSLATLVKPIDDFEIAEGAFEKCGISKEMVLSQGRPAREVFIELQSMFDESDVLLSYNGNRFDIPFIYNEFIRNGLQLTLPQTILDSLVIEQRHNSNKLTDVYKRYFGFEYDGAHDALADVKATFAVFDAQSEKYEDAFDATDFVSPENMLKHDENGKLVFTIGKHKDKSVIDVCNEDAGYISWLFKKFNQGAGISPMMKVAIKNEYDKYKQA